MDLGVRILLKPWQTFKDLESFEPLNPLTPDPDFGNLFCVFWQAIGEFQFAILFLGQAIGEFSRGRVRRTVHCSQAIGRLHTTRKMVFTPWFRAVHTVSCWRLPCRKKTFPKRFYKPKKPFEMVLRAQINGTLTGSKADKKKDSTTAPLLETEFCSDFGFIEAALKWRYCSISVRGCTYW